MGAIETLREMYQWPAVKPELPPDNEGWFCGENMNTLGRLLSPTTKIVVELGSWLGMSSKFIAVHAPNATIICIDHWLGSEEHQRVPQWKAKLPTLFNTFLMNLWEYRDRLIPMRTTILDGLRKLGQLGVAPDLIYVDGSHDEESVYLDVKAALHFPSAWLVGDDATWAAVQAGVKKAIRELNERAPDVSRQSTIVFNGPCWSVAPRLA
jgi:hypothetical protein